MDGKPIDELSREGLSVEFDTSANPILSVDVERYQKYLDDTDLSEAEKAEFLQSLWQVIVSFVELGFGVHPLQEVCGKDEGTCSLSTDDDSDAVSLEHPKDNEDARVASREGGLELE